MSKQTLLSLFTVPTHALDSGDKVILTSSAKRSAVMYLDASLCGDFLKLGDTKTSLSGILLYF